MSGSPPTRESRRADKFARLERKYGDRLRRQDKVATDGKIELTQAEYDAVMADNDALRADAIRCRFAEPRTLTVRQKAQMAQELANLRRDFRNREDESTDPAVAVKALPGVSDYPYPYRRDQKDSNDIRDDYEAIQTQIVDILTKYIDIEKARRIIGLGLLPRMVDDFTNRDSTWADSDDNTRRLLLAYVNSRLVEYIFCPPGPHSNWPAPGQNFRKEGLWAVSQWDVGFGLSAFKYFEEIEGMFSFFSFPCHWLGSLRLSPKMLTYLPTSSPRERALSRTAARDARAPGKDDVVPGSRSWRAHLGPGSPGA